MALTMEPSLRIRLTCCLKEGGSSGSPARWAKEGRVSVRKDLGNKLGALSRLSVWENQKRCISDRISDSEFAQQRLFSSISPHLSSFLHSSQFPLILQTFASVLLRALDVTSVHSYTTAFQGKHRMSSERSGQIILHTALKPRSRVNSMFSRRSQRSHSVNKPLLFLTDATVSKCIDVDLFKKEKKKVYKLVCER